MEHTMTIRLPENQVKNNGADLKSLLLEVLDANKDKVGYLIQDYYPREKVRVVAFELNEPNWEADVFIAKASFTLEQFSVCAAIDSLETSSMLMRLSISKQGDLIVAGEQVFE
jgi:hypothetical protein